MTPGTCKNDCRALLEAILDAVIITDLDGRIIDWNRRAPEVLQRAPAQLRGMPFTALLPTGGEDFLSRAAREPQPGCGPPVEMPLLRGDGATFAAEVAVSRLVLAGAPRLCFLVRDITGRKDAQLALERTVAQCEENNRARTLFIFNVSHELRTPLTSMIYAVNNMLVGVAGPLTDRVRYYLEILEGDCKRLLATVNDILDLRNMETQTLTLVRKRAPFVRLVQRSARTLAMQAQQKKLSLGIEPEHGKWFVDCDAQKMERVVLNLVGNAVKFTPEGGSVAVSVGDDPGRPGHVLLTVRDDGIGIPVEALNWVTLRYFTVGDRPRGSGLGLAISREIVALHGGQMDVQSPPPGFDKGTAIRVSLPASDAPAVLVVDDDEGVLELLSGQVGAEGYRVLRSRTGRGAIDAVSRERPAAMVLDLALPDMNGTELVLKLRSEKPSSSTGIIVVTGAGMSRGREEILSRFDVPMLGKPWDEAELLERLADFFLGSATLGGR